MLGRCFRGGEGCWDGLWRLAMCPGHGLGRQPRAGPGPRLLETCVALMSDGRTSIGMLFYTLESDEGCWDGLFVSGQVSGPGLGRKPLRYSATVA